MSSDYSCVSCRMTVNRAVAKFCSRCGALLLLNQRYRLISKIGEGGFSTVYKAEDNNLGNASRAVKEMSVQSRDPQEVQQAKVSFQQEACLLATLRHSNLPQVYDHFEQSDRSYLVMEFIEGQTLEDYNEPFRTASASSLSEIKRRGSVGENLQMPHRHAVVKRTVGKRSERFLLCPSPHM